mmetsp:Transcript_55/g.201  ORF Transcript_55/g.201 Transcript_55/m.201 type:complete len:244 (-) Transcript_55:2417-3148(-)
MSGRGRGRGRGQRIGPEVRDDQGNVLSDAPGAPPLYPALNEDALELLQETKFKRKPDTDQRLDALREEGTRLVKSWRASVYNLDNVNKSGSVAVVAQVKRWSDRHQPAAAGPGRLSQFMSLTAVYFPGELYSASDKTASLKSAKEQSAILKEAARRNREATAEERAEQDRFLQDRLNLEETLTRKAAEDGKEEEKEDGEEEEEIDDEDEEEDHDDYEMGEHCDDDEGYESDMGGGDDDEGPIF